MFEFIRAHTRWTLGFVLLLIIPSFVFFGIDGYSRFTEGGNATVAEVDGQKITRNEWDLAHRRTVERLRAQQPDLDARELDTPQARRDSLETLVRQRVLMAAARDQHLVPTDQRLQRLFRSDPEFESLRNPDGTVRRELLAAQGLSSEAFAAQLRQDIAMTQVLAGIGRTALAPASIVDAAVEPLLQRREVQFERFDPAALRAGINPGDADIEAYYKANPEAFRTPEQAKIEYVVLDLEALARDVAVPEEDLRKYYEQNQSRYTRAEERRARHILLAADRSASAEDRNKARARAEELLAQVRKAPETFAEVARAQSQDPGSAVNGGDLDFFGRGAMVKPFEDAAYAMKPGEISNVVETDFGFHILKLEETRGGEVQPYEQVRSSIEAEVRKELAQRRYAEAAEQFTNTVYEQPDSLQPVLDKLKLPLQTATVQRKPVPGASGPLASEKLLAAVFTSESISSKRNTEAVETGSNQLVSARVVEHQPARVQPLDEVRQAVRQRVVDQQAAAQAREQGAAKLAELQKSGSTAPLAITAEVSRDQAQGVPRKLVDAVMGADPAKLPLLTGVDLGEQGYVLLRVTRLLPREKQPGEAQQWQQQYAQVWGAAEARAYEAALRQRYKVKIDEAQVAAASAQPTP